MTKVPDLRVDFPYIYIKASITSYIFTSLSSDISIQLYYMASSLPSRWQTKMASSINFARRSSR